VALSGRHAPSKGETLDLLLAINFPNSVTIEGEAGPAAAAMPNVWTGGWLQGLLPMAVVWAIDSFAPY
jgi:hypothetical protein